MSGTKFERKVVRFRETFATLRLDCRFAIVCAGVVDSVALWDRAGVNVPGHALFPRIGEGVAGDILAE